MASYSLQPAISQAPGDLLVGDPAQRGLSWILLGALAEAGPHRKVKLDLSAEHVLAIVGKRGTGKSYTLGVILEGLAAPSRATSIAAAGIPRTALVLDVLDVLWSSAIPLQDGVSTELRRQYQRMRDARSETPPLSIDIWVPAGCERPDLDLPSTQRLGVAASDLSVDDWATLFDLNVIDEPRGMLLEEVVRKVGRTGWTDRGSAEHAAADEYNVADMLRCVETDRDIATSYADTTVRSLRQRLSAQLANPLFAAPRTNLRELMKPGRVTILCLGRLSDSWKHVLCALLLSQILRDRRDASFAQKRLDLDSNLTASDRTRLEGVVDSSLPRTWVLVDEAHVLAPAGSKTLSGEVMVKFAKEGRNYGLSLGVATQQPTAVDARLMSQVETLLCHQLAAAGDIDVVRRSIKSPMPDKIVVDRQEVDESTLFKVLEQGVALLSCANAGSAMSRVCVVKIRARITAHGGYEA